MSHDLCTRPHFHPVSLQAEDGIAAIWLTTAEMGFSLTEEQDEVVCAKDVKAGRITDRFLAPAISRFATDTWSMNKQTAGVRRKVEDLHQRWGKTNAISNSENFKAQADNEAKVTKKFIRIIQRKDLPWERDSIARAANDPEHIPDCNVIRLDNISSFTSRFQEQ